MKVLRRGPRHRAPKQPKTVGQRIWAAREDCGLTQAELAARLHIRQQTVAAWEKDKSTLGATVWDHLRRHLGWSQEALETGKGYARPDASRVAEASHRQALPDLPPLPAGTEVLVISSEGLAHESLNATKASRMLREAVKTGRPVWLVLGS